METFTYYRKTGGKTYTKAFNAFKAQFKDVVRMTRLYVNDQNKVYAGEWIDSKGIINFNGGFAPDVVGTIIFEDNSF